MIVVLVAAGGVAVWRHIYSVPAKYSTSNVAFVQPAAPHLIANPGERVYRIDPMKSSLQYSVNEKLVGVGVHTAIGVTNGIAGDFALNAAAPAKSRVGEIVVNVEQLHSDSSLRDSQIRRFYLGSYTYRFAYLNTTELSGLPATIVDGHTYHFQLLGVLKVKQTQRPVTWDVTGSVANGTLNATATLHVKMSQFGIGPIELVGLVSTGDDVTLTMHLVAEDPSQYSVPTTVPVPAAAHHTGTSPSFKTAVMPILEANCASCHNAGQVGAAHWELNTAGDAAQYANGVGAVVRAKYMPPWPASDKGVPLANSKALDAKSIKILEQWADAGGPIDVPASTKITPKKGPYVPKPRADKVLKMPQPYKGSLSNPNDYRCFVLDPHITKPTWMTGYELVPDKVAEIHHAQIFHVNAQQAAQGEIAGGQDGKPGWQCFGGLSLPNPTPAQAAEIQKAASKYPVTNPSGPSASQFGVRQGSGGAKGKGAKDFKGRGQRGAGGGAGHFSFGKGGAAPALSVQPGLIAGWVPGQDPTIYPEHSGILLEPGDALVLQIHYHYDLPPVPDQSKVILQLAPGTENLKRIDIINPLAPVEIPCLPSQDKAPLCNRNNAIADDARLYGVTASEEENGLLLLCGKTANQLAATFHDGVASSSCTYRVPESGTLVSVFGHEHTLGKTFRLTLDPGTSHSKILLDIPQWNFGWQLNYTLTQPLHVTTNDTVEMQCTWDRSLDPN
ncbi:MAG TPA: YceI family protein, partial [Acidimicrobiia bacterium]